MASLFGIGLSMIVNAVSFSRGSFLFQHLNKNSYEVQMKRHNKELEDLARAKTTAKQCKQGH